MVAAANRFLSKLFLLGNPLSADLMFAFSAQAKLVEHPWMSCQFAPRNPNFACVIGARGFEPPTCRRGDRSSITDQVHLCHGHSCSTVRVVPLESE